MTEDEFLARHMKMQYAKNPSAMKNPEKRKQEIAIGYSKHKEGKKK